ncbi:MAG: TetR/AcrR family transcriptional regulator [Actinobacteria bacterium]|nr:TetR/AcrR family transcriptional regulator [Actinomycetota bacterium]
MAESLKEKVIRAAVDYIAESGPDSLSFRQIAANAGVSHQAPYHHFGDRDAIFTEIALIGFRTLSADLAAPVRRDEDPDPSIRLLERYVNFALANTGYFRVMFRSDLCKIGESPDLQKTAATSTTSTRNSYRINQANRCLTPRAAAQTATASATSEMVNAAMVVVADV